MSTLYVSYLGGVDKGVAKEPIACVTIDTSATTAKTTNPAPSNACIAVVIGDVAHYVNTGLHADVTAAATNGIYVPANVERHLAINPGDGVAAITV